MNKNTKLTFLDSENTFCHNYIMRVVLILVSVCFLSCALPNEDLRQPPNFIPKQEQLAISLIREGNDYFLKGRYYNAEIKFRQADYLFPNQKNIKINLANALIRSRQFDLAELEYAKLAKLFPDDIDVILLRGKYLQALENYDAAIKSYLLALAQARKLELIPYQVTIAENLSATYYLIGEESLALKYSGLAYLLMNTPEIKANYARLQVGLGLKELSSDLKVNPNRLNKADQDFLTWQLLITQLENPEQSLKLINQLRLFNGEKTKLSLDAQFLEIINSKEPSEEELKNLKETIIPMLWREGVLKPEIRLYWPINLIQELRQACIRYKEDEEVSCEIL